MDTSVHWINDYLASPRTAEEQADILTRAGFPFEGGEAVQADGVDDVRQDFEMTSNRGDCVCHLGLAREIAAITRSDMKPPAFSLPETGGAEAASSVVTVTNHEHDGCPRYTARVIRGVKVGPSPDWLQARLRARGDIPRNNIVDATNFVLFESGQPTHVFDLAKLKGSAIQIRRASEGEAFLPLGEDAKSLKLTGDDLVIADAESAVAIAGVKGGASSAVTESTTDVVIEAATFDPVCVRDASRRHGIGSDSSYRFERGVHPAHIDEPAARLAALILEVAGGTLCSGVVEDGAPIPAAKSVSMRASRARRLTGLDLSMDDVTDALGRLGFAPTIDPKNDDQVICTVPVHRLDIDREVDLVEEVARMQGYDSLPVRDSVAVQVRAPQAEVAASRALADTLVGLGFVETVTHSLIAEEAATPFFPGGLTPLRVDDDRAGGEPILRPSILPSLLQVASLNRDRGQSSLRFFERAACFAEMEDGHLETRNVAFVHDASKKDDNPLRTTRGVIDRLIRLLAGTHAVLDVEPLNGVSWLAPAAVIRLDGVILGTMGMLTPAALKPFGITGPIAGAELGLERLFANWPPETMATPLPSFPAIERDLSLLVSDETSWRDITDVIHELSLPALDGIDHVATYRDKKIGEGRKSLTLRLRFRLPDRTLRHEEIDPTMETLVDALQIRTHAEVRSS